MHDATIATSVTTTVARIRNARILNQSNCIRSLIEQNVVQMKILVTGGAGFIASHIVDAYVERGHAVTVVDNLSSGQRENVNRRAELVVADLRDPKTADMLRGGRFDILNHHAAQIDVRVSVADPAADAELNIVATLRLVQALFTAALKKIVFSANTAHNPANPVAFPHTQE